MSILSRPRSSGPCNPPVTSGRPYTGDQVSSFPENFFRSILDSGQGPGVQSSTLSIYDGVQTMTGKNEKPYEPDFEISNPDDKPDEPIPYRPTTLRERRELIVQEREWKGSKNGEN